MQTIDTTSAPSLDFDLLRTFMAVVDAESFTRAETRVHRTQSTVSRQIRRLEEDLGCRLIGRNGGAVVPTEQGEVLRGYALRLLAISAEARRLERSRPPGRGAAGPFPKTSPAGN